MIVDCSYCEARVDGQVIAQHIDSADPDTGVDCRLTLLACPSCGNGLVASEYGYSDQTGGQWSVVERVWPSPGRAFSWLLPEIVRSSLNEADKCFHAGALSACAVMCGRSLEGICRHYKTKSDYLGGGLRELLETGIIDSRLFAWSEALRKSRNLGAHASAEIVSKEDARDLLDFANAIAEYVFDLTYKFKAFMERQTKTAGKS